MKTEMTVLKYIDPGVGTGSGNRTKNWRNRTYLSFNKVALENIRITKMSVTGY